jgi:hypothetical protein
MGWPVHGVRRLAYRQFHDQSAMAVVTLVTMAEFGLIEFDSAKRGQELVIHGLIQQGVYRADRGTCMSRAWAHMARSGLSVAARQDSKRSVAIQQRLRVFEPQAEYHLARDLGAEASPRLNLPEDLAGGARVILLQAQMWNARLAVHPLLVRADEGRLFVMNPFTGRDEEVTHQHLSVHIASPVHAGPRQFAGGIYLDTGLALRLVQP